MWRLDKIETTPFREIVLVCSHPAFEDPIRVVFSLDELREFAFRLASAPFNCWIAVSVQIDEELDEVPVADQQVATKSSFNWKNIFMNAGNSRK